MSRCEFCNRPTKARFEYAEAQRVLQRRISNQRKEIARLLKSEAVLITELVSERHSKAQAKYDAERAASLAKSE